MKKHLLLLFAAFFTLVASARESKVEIDEIWYILDERAHQAEVTSGGNDRWERHEYTGSITIPGTVTYEGVDYSVTCIGDDAFRDCRSLTAITLPEGVTSIESWAFSGCSSLTAITIPESVASIGNNAFWICGGLTSITIPESVTSIGGDAFSSCDNLTSIVVAEGNKVYDSRNRCNAIIETSSNTLIQGCSATIIPASVTSIGKAFFHCDGLTSITIPEGVTSIGNDAFCGCSSLTSITIPESVTSIGGDAFYLCRSLTAITIPASVTSIGIEAFAHCSNLTAIVVAEGNKVYDSRGGCNAIIETSSNTLIQGCSATIIPASVTSIGSSAFRGCDGLTSITIPESVTSIGEYAFSECNSLKSITLPEGVTSIGERAFWACRSLTAITCKAVTPPTCSSDAFYGVDKFIPVYVPAGSVEAYKVAEGWSEFTNISMSVPITHITLSQSSATLLVEESLTLTATVAPDNATDKTLTWSSNNPSVATVDNMGKVTAIAPGTATITATANNGSGVSAQCEVTVNELILGKCATPTISYKDGKVVLTCETEGAKVITTVANGDDEIFEVFDFDLIPTYTLTAYATKENYEDSDVATLTLCWVPCDEKHESEETGILIIPAKPVLISTQGGTITVSGLAAGTEASVYSTAGTQLATATATDGTATLTTNLEAGSIAIVKIGDYSIRVAVK